MKNYLMSTAAIAEVAHRGQFRKYNKDPYIRHPMRVASRVMLIPEATEAMVAAAMCHDVLEDTELTESLLRQSLISGCAFPLVTPQAAVFDSKVVDDTVALVKELTNQFTKEAHPEMRREERKKREVARIKTISPQAKMIKICDRIDNLREQDPRDGFAVTYLEETKELYEALSDIQEGVFPLYQAVSRSELCLELRETMDSLLTRVEKHRTLQNKLAEIYGVFE